MNKLKLYRLLREKTQDELSSATGIDQAALSRIERGKRPTPEQRLRIAEALGIEPGLLFPRPEDKRE